MIRRTLTRPCSRLHIQHAQITLTRRQLIHTCNTHSIHCHSATTTAAHRQLVSSCHPSVLSSFLRVSSWFLFRGYRPPRRRADDADDTDDTGKDGKDEPDIADDRVEADVDESELERQVDPSHLTKAERLKLKQKEKNRQKQLLRGRSAKKDKEKFKKVEVGNEIDIDETQEAAISEESKQAFVAVHIEQQQEEEQQQQQPSLSGKTGSSAHAPLGPGEHRIGSQISSDPIMLLGPDKKKIGLVVLSAALKKAHENGLEVVQLSPDHVRPAVCRVVDLHDFLYEEQLKQAESVQQPVLKVKTMQMRKNIAINDYRVKLRQMEYWLSMGHPVRFMYFETQPVEAEMQAMFKRVQHDLEAVGSAQIAAEGTTAMTFMPKKQKPEQGTVAMQQQAPEQTKRASKLSREQAESAHMAQSQ